MKLEELFNSDVVYQSVFHAEGSKAHKWLKLIDSEGAHETLRDMLIKLPYDPEPILDGKPWKVFSHKEKIGDYILYWDNHKEVVGVVELGRTNGRDY